VHGESCCSVNIAAETADDESMQSGSSSGDYEDESQNESEDSDLANLEARLDGLEGVPRAMEALMMSPFHPL